MIERINSQIGIQTALLRTAQTALADIPRKLHSIGRHHHQSIAPRTRSWERSQPAKRDLGTIIPLVVRPQNEAEDLNPRQWLANGNPRLGKLVSEAIGDRWSVNLEALQQLIPLAEQPSFQKRWQAVKRANKQVLADRLYHLQGLTIDIDSLFDVQLQPIDGQQRQLLNILHIITLFNRIKENPQIDLVPRTFIFGESEATGLEPIGLNEPIKVQDNRVISLLIRSLTKILLADPDVNGRLQVIYIPQSAGLNDEIYAAADLTEQIEVAQVDDLDLSKLKFAVNGVLSIGSLSKANQLIKQTVGEDNYFSFGLAIPEIALFKEYGYDPNNYYKYYPEVQQTIDSLLAGKFTPGYPAACRDLRSSFWNG